MHDASTRVFSVVLAVLGVAILVRTLTAGGGPLSIGFVLGALFLAAGLGRLYIARTEDRT